MGMNIHPHFLYVLTMAKHYYKNREHRANAAVKIFDTAAKDLSYISNNKHILYRHTIFINKCRDQTCINYKRFTVPEGKFAGMHSRIFAGFREYYPTIYSLWMHILRSCLDKTYVFYPYFGGKGIYPEADFLDSRKFTIWCLRNGFIYKPFTYTMYLQRKDKTKGYSARNCYFITEREAHAPSKLSDVINSIRLIRFYEEEHDKSVSYMTFYTRYYMYDMNEYDARIAEYPKVPGFSPVTFYESVAGENDCSRSTFLSRYHYSYLNGGHTARPYDMLKPEYSVKAVANSEGKLSYKQQYDRNIKENKDKYNPYINPNEFNIVTEDNNQSDVYIKDDEFDVYS